MRVLFNIFAVAGLLVIFTSPAFSADNACDEAEKLWNERIEFDAQMRFKRYEITKEQLKLKEQMAESDREIAQALQQITKTAEEGRDALWSKIDVISAQRDEISKRVDELAGRSKQITDERMKKKTDIRLKFVGKKYECLFNNELTEKIGSLVKEARSKGRLTPVVQARLETLYNHRVELSAKAGAEFEDYNKRLPPMLEAFQKAYQDRDNAAAKETEAELVIDRLYDEIYNTADSMREKISAWRQELAKGSGEINSIIKK